MSTSKIMVWDIPTRLFHWLLVGSFAVAYLTAEADGWENVHYTAGFTLLGLIVFRLIWGFAGSRYARFSDFSYSPSQVLNYLRNMKNQHHLGHNPLGSMAVFALLGLGLLTALSGGLIYLSGSEWLEEPHEIAANVMLAVVGVHILGVVASSKLHGENLTRAMITGQKQGNARDSIPSRHGIIAALLLTAVLGFLGYSYLHPFATDKQEAAEQHEEKSDHE